MKRFIVSLLVLGSMVFAGDMQQQSVNKADKTMQKHMGKKGKKHKKMFQSVSRKKATILQDGKAKMFCPECGMTLPMFYKTNHAATVDGKVKQFCSMHCLGVAAKHSSDIKHRKVVDVKSLKFIPVSKATYVVGSSKKGTMSMKSKYAFAKKKDAKKFAKKFGGKVVGFKKAYKIANKTLSKESKMIAKKQAKMAKKGEMMYNKMCKKTDLKFGSTAEAKGYLKSSGICGKIKGKKLQAIGIYLGRR
jgi:hypothetical protein